MEKDKNYGIVLESMLFKVSILHGLHNDFLGEVSEIRCGLQPFSSWKISLRGCFKPEDSAIRALQAVGLLYGRSTNCASRSRKHKQNLCGFLILESSPKRL